MDFRGATPRCPIEIPLPVSLPKATYNVKLLIRDPREVN